MADHLDSPDSANMSRLGKDSHGHSHGPGGECASSSSKPKMPSIFDAVKSGMLIPVQSIVEMEGPEILRTRDSNGHTATHWACLGGHTTILRFMIENKCPIEEPSENELGQYPMHWASVNGHVSIVDILIKAGASIDVTDNKGCTALIVACQYGKTMLSGYLLGRGARVHMVDKDGDSALHWAAFKGHSELMRLLIYSGFNARQTDNFGQTPLHLACISGNLTSVQELCEQDGVEVDLRDKNSKTPLMLAMGRKHDKIEHYLKKESRYRKSLIPRLDIWNIVFGPPGNSKAPLLFFVVNVIFWGYPMYVYKCIPMTWYDLQPLHILFMLLNVVMWISLYHANSVDPGFLPRNVPEYDEAIKQIAHYDEWKQGRNPLKRICHTCRTIKPIRSKHCRVCNRCVKMFDHHCPYIYNCVGYNNRVWFYTFVNLVALMCASTVYFCIYMLQNGGFDWIVVIGLVDAGFFTIIAFVVWGCTMYHIYLNLTTNERINYKRYDYLKDGKGQYYNPFNRGPFNNFLEFMYLKRPLGEEDVELLNVTTV